MRIRTAPSKVLTAVISAIGTFFTGMTLSGGRDSGKVTIGTKKLRPTSQAQTIDTNNPNSPSKKGNHRVHRGFSLCTQRLKARTKKMLFHSGVHRVREVFGGFIFQINELLCDLCGLMADYGQFVMFTNNVLS